MRPIGTRTRRVARAVLVLALVIVGGTVPVSRVAACSCAGFGEPKEVVAAHDVTCIGTVVDSVPGARDEFGEAVLYAFDVDRASAPTDALLVVRAGVSGASCGITFGMGERWLVSAHRQGAELETGLCSNNQFAGDIPADDMAAFRQLLPNLAPEPAETATETSPSDASIPLAAGVAALAVLALAAISMLAFRAGGRRPG
jgi:hypothetical protein